MYQVPAPNSVAAFAVVGDNRILLDVPQFGAVTVVVALFIVIVKVPVALERPAARSRTALMILSRLFSPNDGRPKLIGRPWE